MIALPLRVRSWLALAAVGVILGLGAGTARAQEPDSPAQDQAKGKITLPIDRDSAIRTTQTVALFALVSLAPIALLMTTAFVRINITLTLLRQAMGSPQVPGNNVITALALLLTLLVMRPRGEAVYHDAIAPFARGELSAQTAWEQGVQPIKRFMIDQLVRARHEYYLPALLERSQGTSAHPVEPPDEPDRYPLTVIAPAFLLSEIAVALKMGFFLYLPFLVIDLTAASVLGAAGLYMLPPAAVATPSKLIIFVLADGWMLTAAMLLESFASG